MDIPLIYKNGILISCRKYSRLPRNPSKAALRAGWLEKNHPRFAPVFFPPSLAWVRANGQQGNQEIKMPVPQAGMYEQ